jgi:uncharacterized protein
MSSFKFENTDQTVPDPLPADFTITTPTSTDIWIKPPSTNRFNAPILHQTFPLSSFQKARVSVSGLWKDLYDQGGLILVVPQSDGTTHWVKTGIEFYEGQPMASTVAATSKGADWSLLSIPGGRTSVTIEMVNEKGSLWIYVIEGVKHVPVREVAWILGDAESKGDCWVGAFAAKPSETGGKLDVNFSHLVIEKS